MGDRVACAAHTCRRCAAAKRWLKQSVLAPVHPTTTGRAPYFSAGAEDIHSGQLAIDLGDDVYLAYPVNDTTIGAVVVKYARGQWTTVGAPTSLLSGLPSSLLQSGSSWAVQLAVGPSGIPVAAVYGAASAPHLRYDYYEIPNPRAGPVTVRTFDGAAWTTVGATAFATGVYPSLALNADSVPHLALGDASVGRRATVLRFNGASWQPLGPRGFSTGGAYWNHLAVDPLGTVHLAFADDAEQPPRPYKYAQGPVVVKRFEGVSWLNVGNNQQVDSEFTTEGVYPALAFGPGPSVTPHLVLTSPWSMGSLLFFRHPGPPSPPPVSAWCYLPAQLCAQSALLALSSLLNPAARPSLAHSHLGHLGAPLPAASRRRHLRDRHLPGLCSPQCSYTDGYSADDTTGQKH